MDKQSLQENAKGLRRLEIVIAILALSFYLLCAVSANAAGPDLKPEERNGDYLKQVPGAPLAIGSLNSMIFDKAISAEMTEKYQAFNRDYEAKQAYRLTSPADYMNYQKANQDLVEWTIKKLLQYHFENTLKNRVEEGAKRAARESKSSETQAAASAVMTVSKVQKAITNTTLNLGQDTKTRFKYDFPSGVMRVGMTSPLADASMDYRIKAPDPAPGAIAQPEKLSVGVSRNFREIAASTSARYSLVGQTVNYGMSKHVLGPVSAQVDQVHNIRDTSKDETVYRVNVGLKF
ncbi:MAG: hypothetical protein HY075_05495 [Deltaproteobacteria bacterium]|nr:hypothetical protein [Deltaproteobacteria bacterium]